MVKRSYIAPTRGVGLEAIESSRWTRLWHAYGLANDTPEHLRALLDAREPKPALEHLRAAIIHQSSPWTATAPAALVVIGLWDDPRLDRRTELRPELVRFLAAVVGFTMEAYEMRESLEEMAQVDIADVVERADEEALFDGSDEGNAFYAHGFLACLEIAPTLLDGLLRCLDDPRPELHPVAGQAAARLVRIPLLAHRREPLLSRLKALREEAVDDAERQAELHRIVADLDSR